MLWDDVTESTPVRSMATPGWRARPCRLKTHFQWRLTVHFSNFARWDIWRDTFHISYEKHSITRRHDDRPLNSVLIRLGILPGLLGDLLSSPRLTSGNLLKPNSTWNPHFSTLENSSVSWPKGFCVKHLCDELGLLCWCAYVSPDFI